MAKNITVIPATLDRHTGIPSHIHHKRRVAGYARVSTDSEEQLTSYEAQVDYYTRYIHAKEETDNWEFVQVYTDEGISATNTKRRDGFNAMVRDALDGKIDLIINTPVGKKDAADDSYIRKNAIRHHIPYFTTMAAARATASGIRSEKRAEAPGITSLQEFHARITG